MKSPQYLMLAGILAALAAVSSPFSGALAQTEEVRVSQERLLEGDWRGPDGDGYLTFRFQYKDGVWLGFFVSERDGRLFPVEEVQVSDRSVSFRHKSRPELIFSLAVEDDDRTLSGTAMLPDGMVTTYSFTRK